MSIATAITNLQGKIANAYTAIENKGGTLPATRNAQNLSATIDAIPTEASGPRWGVNALSDILQTRYSNPSYVVHNFLNLWGNVQKINFENVENIHTDYPRLDMGKSNVISVNFPNLKTVFKNGLEKSFAECSALTNISFPVLSSSQDAGFMLTFNRCKSLSSISFPSFRNCDSKNTFASAFYDCSLLQSVSFQELSNIGMLNNNQFNNAFANCSSLTAVSFPKIQYGNGYTFTSAFVNCTALKSVDFSSLLAMERSGAIPGYATKMFENAFKNCTSLESVSFPNLKNANGTNSFEGAFTGCTSLSSVSFPNMESISGNYVFAKAFNGCTGLTSISFPSLTSITGTGSLSLMFNGCTAMTEIHFKSGMESVVSSTTGYSDKWGATNATIYFDL